MRIMLDTNVLISIFVFKSKRLEQLLNEIFAHHTLVLSSYILDELYEVVERKFQGKIESLDTFLSRIPYELEHTPKKLPYHNLFAIRDEQDEKVFRKALCLAPHNASSLIRLTDTFSIRPLCRFFPTANPDHRGRNAHKRLLAHISVFSN